MSAFYSAPKRALFRLLAIVLSLGTSLVVLELAFRAWDRQWARECFLGTARSMLRLNYPTRHDSQLGWVPDDAADRTSGAAVRILPGGYRSNGRPEAAVENAAAPEFLAVGDSFTWGTRSPTPRPGLRCSKPRLGKSVLNAGVFGYGLDQSTLRTLDLLPRVSPRTLLFSFVPDDIFRCQFSERYSAWKPWFEPVEGTLVLRGVPVPLPEPPIAWVEAFKDMAGWSWAVHRLMSTYAPAAWTQHRLRCTTAHNRGAEVARLLLGNLERASAAAGIELVVLAQFTFPAPDFPEQYGMVDDVLAGSAFPELAW